MQRYINLGTYILYCLVQKSAEKPLKDESLFYISGSVFLLISLFGIDTDE